MPQLALKKFAFLSVVIGLIEAGTAVSATERECDAGPIPTAISTELSPAQARKANRDRPAEPAFAAPMPETDASTTQISRQAHAARHERNLQAITQKVESIEIGGGEYSIAERREWRGGEPASAIVC